jgi:hypothetical protein
MTTEGWIFMVGLRVFDVGALIVWLVWFFRLRDDPDDDGGGPGGSGGPETPPPPPEGPPGDGVPLPDAAPWPRRRRDHAGDRAPATVPARRTRPSPAEPVRYRSSSWPA